MRIVLTAMGSRGDAQPLLALAQNLDNLGQDAVLGVPFDCIDFVRRFPTACHGICEGFSARRAADPEAITFHPLSGWVGFVRFLRAQIRTQFRATLDISQDADLILASGQQFAAASVAEYLGIPYIYVATSPRVIPSIHYAPTGEDFHPRLNRLMWSGLRVVLNRLFRNEINRMRSRFGLNPIRDLLGHIISDHPVLVASSPIITSRPSDWVSTYMMTGYWYLEEEWTPPPNLQAFLDSGPPPVCIGFGSMAFREPSHILDCIVTAVNEVGTRALLVGRWQHPEGPLVPNLYVLDEAPYIHVYAKSAVAVHHGGAGATAAALRAGIPSVAIPHIGDDTSFWARRVASLGAGTAPIPRRRLSSDWLASAIHSAITDDRMRRRAEQLSHKLLQEDGIKNAVTCIGKHMARNRRYQTSTVSWGTL